jgi:hypothetical protein
MKRRLVKNKLRALESRTAGIARRYITLGKRTHKDVLFKLEYKLEAIFYRILNIHLRLDPSWHHNERWLEFLDDVSWTRDGASLRGQGTLRYGLLTDIGGQLYSEPLQIQIRLQSSTAFQYSVILGDHQSSRTFSRHVKIPKRIALEPL